jgi:hypothetical protein
VEKLSCLGLQQAYLVDIKRSTDHLYHMAA